MNYVSDKIRLIERIIAREDDRYAMLHCPHCGLYIGNPEDPVIAHISVSHDFGACEERQFRNLQSAPRNSYFEEP